LTQFKLKLITTLVYLTRAADYLTCWL